MPFVLCVLWTLNYETKFREHWLNEISLDIYSTFTLHSAYISSLICHCVVICIARLFFKLTYYIIWQFFSYFECNFYSMSSSVWEKSSCFECASYTYINFYVHHWTCSVRVVSFNLVGIDLCARAHTLSLSLSLTHTHTHTIKVWMWYAFCTAALFSCLTYSLCWKTVGKPDVCIVWVSWS